MNNLSWLIYFAEVVNNFNAFIGISCGLAILCILFYMLFSAIEETSMNPKGKWKKGLRYIWIPFLFLGISCFIPSGNTIYMLAASEVGEQVIKTPEAKEVFDSLKARILDELKVETK